LNFKQHLTRLAGRNSTEGREAAELEPYCSVFAPEPQFTRRRFLENPDQSVVIACDQRVQRVDQFVQGVIKNVRHEKFDDSLSRSDSHCHPTILRIAEPNFQCAMSFAPNRTSWDVSGASPRQQSVLPQADATLRHRNCCDQLQACPLGVILMGLRIAKVYAVAQILRDETAGAADRLEGAARMALRRNR
jgi:hypothetical protein